MSEMWLNGRRSCAAGAASLLARIPGEYEFRFSRYTQPCQYYQHRLLQQLGTLLAAINVVIKLLYQRNNQNKITSTVRCIIYRGNTPSVWHILEIILLSYKPEYRSQLFLQTKIIYLGTVTFQLKAFRRLIDNPALVNLFYLISNCFYILTELNIQ